MIVRENGRSRSVRTKQENLDQIQTAIAMLRPAERRLFNAVMREMKAGSDDLLKLMSESRYRWAPVSMREFIEDDYYLGRSTKSLYPRIRADLIEMFDTPGYGEVILTGSLGFGKTTCLSIGVCRMLYELSCLIDPQESYGLSSGSEMVLVLLSKSVPTARDVMKTAVDLKLEKSQYFADNFPFAKSQDVTRFPNNVILTIASSGSDRVIGMNVFAAAMDEANFMQSKSQVINTLKKGIETFDMAEKVYSGLLTRIKSRFSRAGGELPGKLFTVSSANTKGAFLERRIKKSINDSTIFCREYALWDAKPADHFCGKTFKVVVGSSSLRSKIIPDGEEVNRDAVELDDGTLIDVPVEFRPDFESNIEGAIRDLAGISTHAISPFIHRVEKIVQAQKRGPECHPFTRKVWQFGDTFDVVWEKLCRPYKRRLAGGFEEIAWVPRVRPDAPRWLHIDPSLSGDSVGITMAHIDRWVEVVRRTDEMEEYTDLAPYYVTDFSLRVMPPFGEQIQLAELRGLVYSMQAHGFTLAGVSLDSYQSADTMQQMENRNVHAEMISMDRTEVPYETLKQALYENRLDYYEYHILTDELKALERDRIKGKIDHPAAGTKDVSDSLAGAIFGLSRSALRAVVPIVDIQTQPGEDDESWALGRRTVEKTVDQPNYVPPMPFLIG